MGIGTFVNQPARPITAPQRRKRTSTGDLILIAAVIALCIFGLLMLYSASTDFSYLNYGSQTFMFNKQLIFLAGGILIAFRPRGWITINIAALPCRSWWWPSSC